MFPSRMILKLYHKPVDSESYRLQQQKKKKRHFYCTSWTWCLVSFVDPWHQFPVILPWLIETHKAINVSDDQEAGEAEMISKRPWAGLSMMSGKLVEVYHSFGTDCWHSGSKGASEEFHMTWMELKRMILQMRRRKMLLRQTIQSILTMSSYPTSLWWIMLCDLRRFKSVYLLLESKSDHTFCRLGDTNWEINMFWIPYDWWWRRDFQIESASWAHDSRLEDLQDVERDDDFEEDVEILSNDIWFLVWLF